jgi:hypothetical protein
MKPAHSLLSAALFASVLLAQEADVPTLADPVLRVSLLPGAVECSVASSSQPFLGGFLVSLNPNLMHFLQGLPPLLADSVVLDAGVSPGLRYTTSVPDVVFPAGIPIHVQGVVYTEAGGFQASGVESFVLDVTFPR